MTINQTCAIFTYRLSEVGRGDEKSWEEVTDGDSECKTFNTSEESKLLCVANGARAFSLRSDEVSAPTQKECSKDLKNN